MVTVCWFFLFWCYFDLVKLVKFGVSGHFLKNPLRKWPNILHAAIFWPPSKMIRLWLQFIDFLILMLLWFSETGQILAIFFFFFLGGGGGGVLGHKEQITRLTKENLWIMWHDDVTKSEQFPSSVNSPLKGQWRGVLMFSLIYARISGWVITGEAGDCHYAHYYVIVMANIMLKLLVTLFSNAEFS